MVFADRREKILSSPSILIKIWGIKTFPFLSSSDWNCDICSSGTPNCSNTSGKYTFVIFPKTGKKFTISLKSMS